MMEQLVSRYPDLLLETCAGGGARFDAGMLYYSPQIWCSDNTDAIDRLEVQYGTSFLYPVSAMGAHVSVCPNHQTGRTTSMDTRAAVAMSGTFGYELDLEHMTEEEKELWKKTGLEAGARKVRFVPRLQESGTALVIQTGYAGTELGLFAGGRLVKSQYILFGGRAMDEDIQQLVARRTRCLLHLEDARALRLSASQALWKGANPLLEVSGLNRYGEYETVQIRAAALWPGMKPVIDQIVSWTGSLLEAASMEARELFMKEGLSLRGSLSACFGLPQTLVQTLGYPVRREEEHA